MYDAEGPGLQTRGGVGVCRSGQSAQAAGAIAQRTIRRSLLGEESSTYALALDGHKRPCQVKTSNAGHCLYTGIATEEHARRVAETLMSDEVFSGWGVRTLADSERRYNPMSYHNGSIWPHDNAMIAVGLRGMDSSRVWKNHDRDVRGQSGPRLPPVAGALLRICAKAWSRADAVSRRL